MIATHNIRVRTQVTGDRNRTECSHENCDHPPNHISVFYWALPILQSQISLEVPAMGKGIADLLFTAMVTDDIELLERIISIAGDVNVGSVTRRFSPGHYIASTLKRSSSLLYPKSALYLLRHEWICISMLMRTFARVCITMGSSGILPICGDAIFGFVESHSRNRWRILGTLLWISWSREILAEAMRGSSVRGITWRRSVESWTTVCVSTAESREQIWIETMGVGRRTGFILSVVPIASRELMFLWNASHIFELNVPIFFKQTGDEENHAWSYK